MLTEFKYAAFALASGAGVIYGDIKLQLLVPIAGEAWYMNVAKDFMVAGIAAGVISIGLYFIKGGLDRLREMGLEEKRLAEVQAQHRAAREQRVAEEHAARHVATATSSVATPDVEFF